MKIYRAFIEINDGVCGDVEIFNYAYHLFYETAQNELNIKLKALQSLNLKCFSIVSFGIKSIHVRY